MIEKLYQRVLETLNILDPVVKWMQDMADHPDWGHPSNSLKELQPLLLTTENELKNLLVLARTDTDDKDLREQFTGIIEPFLKEFTRLRLKIAEQLALGDVGMNQAIFAAGHVHRLCMAVMWQFIELSAKMKLRIAN